MSYDVGQHIDLSYINRKSKPAAAVPSRQKKTIKEAATQGYVVGTRFIFTLTPSGLKAAIQVPVAFGRVCSQSK